MLKLLNEFPKDGKCSHCPGQGWDGSCPGWSWGVGAAGLRSGQEDRPHSSSLLLLCTPGGSFSPFHGVKTIEKYQAGDVKNVTSNLNVLMEQKQCLGGILWSVVHDDQGRDSDLGAEGEQDSTSRGAGSCADSVLLPRRFLLWVI